jgi:PAS domain S-box-containing protein
LKKSIITDIEAIDQKIAKNFESLEELPNTKPIVLLSRDGIILYANSSLKKKYGFEEGESAFKLNSDPDLKILLEKVIERNLRNFSCDFHVLNTVKYENYFLELERLYIEEQEFFLLQIEEQESRYKIAEKLNTFSQALDAVDVGVVISDKDGAIKFISTSFEKFLNKRIDSLYNCSLTTAMEKYLTDIELAELNTAIEEKRKWAKVISDISQDGDVFYKEIRLNIIENNVDRTTNLILTANDITEQVKQARLLRKSEQKQKSIINNISDPILIVRKEQNELIFENANNSFYKSIELTKEETVEHKLVETVQPELFDLIETSVNNLLQDNRIHAQFHYYDSEKNKRFIGKVTYTDDHYDNTRLFIINLTDITEQLEIEKRLREAYNKEISLNKLKSSFLANMSHEIRTPLNAIVGYSELLEDDVKAQDYESSTEMTSHLKDGVKRLLNLVDNIVEVSLLESGNFEMEFEKVDVREVIIKNKIKWLQQGKNKNISFEFNVSNDDLTIIANEEKLGKALSEVVFNAVKYNIENGKIVISACKEENNVIIKVCDTGIGIEEKELNKIFELFEQVEEEGYTRRYEGAGLGLSIANKLIAFMKGKLNIQSQPTQGTTITIAFNSK